MSHHLRVIQHKMSSGDKQQKNLIKKMYVRKKKKLTVGPPPTSIYTEGTSSIQPTSLSQSSPPLHATASTSTCLPTPDNIPSYYPPPPPEPATAGPFTPVAPEQVGQVEQAMDGRMVIEPDGDTFNPSKQSIHKIRDIIQSRYNAPYISWMKVPKEVWDMWFKEFEKDFCWLPQHNDKIRMNFEKRGSARMRDIFIIIRKSGKRPLWIGESVWAELNAAWSSPEYLRRREQNRQNRASDIRSMSSSLHIGGSIPYTEHRRCLEEYTQLQDSQPIAANDSSTGSTEYLEAVGGMQHDRVYGLGSQAHVYEGQSSSSSSFALSSQDSVYSQQIAVLTAKLEQVRKDQSDWQRQQQIQQQQILDEMRKMREQFEKKNVDSEAEETKSE